MHQSFVHPTVRLSSDDGIALIEIDNPPVNAGSHAVRSGLIEALRAAEDNGARAAILIGAGRSFISGSDLREFGKLLGPPELPDVIRMVETVAFPVVAALQGVALGGGLELALGCDYRIAAPGTTLGLPEASLGMVPGAGGTQRLPRLVGQPRAIEMICGSLRIDAAEALKDGLLDRLAEGDLLTAAKTFLNETAREKRLTMELVAAGADDTGAVAERALKRGRGRPNITEAIRLVRASSDPDSVGVLADERAVFQRLRLSKDAFALRYLFFAERKASSVEGLVMGIAQEIVRIGVVGGGTMGQGIVRAFLGAGFPVTLMERDDPAIQAALSALHAARCRRSEERHAAFLKGLNGTSDIADLADCDLVVEAVFEDMWVKKDLLGRLERVVSPGAIIATNTSYLDIDVMAEGLSNPERVVGLHFFSPADIMPLLEIVRARQTSDIAMATAIKVARRLAKQPVIARVGEGFIGNRIYAAYRRQAEFLVLDGAEPQQVDAAMRDFGFAMGPFEVSDMSGLDIAWAMRKRQAATRDPKARYVSIADRLCEAGRLGRKTGRGWYDYSDARAPKPDAEVDRIIEAARSEAGITTQAFDTVAIQRLLLSAIVNEAACLLEDGIAQRPEDVDVALTNGYGFPRWKGGPLYWAALEQKDALERDLKDLASTVGHGHRVGDVRRFLNELPIERDAPGA